MDKIFWEYTFIFFMIYFTTMIIATIFMRVTKERWVQVRQMWVAIAALLIMCLLIVWGIAELTNLIFH